MPRGRPRAGMIDERMEGSLNNNKRAANISVKRVDDVNIPDGRTLAMTIINCIMSKNE